MPCSGCRKRKRRSEWPRRFRRLIFRVFIINAFAKVTPMKFTHLSAFCLALAGALISQVSAADAPLLFKDPAPKRYDYTARASQIDPKAKAHPEISFLFEKDGKPADTEKASVDTRVKPQG